MPSITDVVKHLIIINVLVFIGTITLLADSRLNLALYYPGSEYFEPYQIVTHMFMHADFGHLAFNMLSLFFLGPWVERYWGPRRFLFYYFFCGLGAALIQILSMYYVIENQGMLSLANIPMLGASGAIYGVIIAFAVLFPNVQLMLLFPPIPIKAKYLAVILIGIDLFFGVSGQQTNIAHFAHLGGALFGFLLILFWKKFSGRS